MALSANVLFDIWQNGSDTACSAGFNPANANMATDGTTTAGTGNTASPVFSSASYTFVANDVGHWLFEKSGTNGIPAWYQIASVSGGKATLTAGIGTAFLKDANNHPNQLNTVAGIATVGTPTNLTWTVDYSHASGAAFSFTDLVAATSTTFTSVGNPIGKNMIGNLIAISSGTGWQIATAGGGAIGTAGTGYTNNDTVTISGGTSTVAATFQIKAVSGGVPTQIIRVNGGAYSVTPANDASTTGGTGTGLKITVGWVNMLWEVSSVAGTTGTATNFQGGSTIAANSSTGGTGALGGAFATPGMFGAVHVGSNIGFQKYSASNYTMSSSTLNIPSGSCGLQAGSDGTFTRLYGYNTLRHISNLLETSRPYNIATAGNMTMFSAPAGSSRFEFYNLIADGQAPGTNTTVTPFNGILAGFCRIWNCVAKNYDFRGIWQWQHVIFCECETGNTHSAFETNVACAFCCANVINSPNFGAAGFDGCTYCFCCIANNTGGGYSPLPPFMYINCVATNCVGGSIFGFEPQSSGGRQSEYINCIGWGNYQNFNGANGGGVIMLNCGTGGATHTADSMTVDQLAGNIALSADPHVNSTSGPPFNFQLNATAGGGALLRTAAAQLFGANFGTTFRDVNALQHQDSGGASPNYGVRTGGRI